MNSLEAWTASTHRETWMILGPSSCHNTVCLHSESYVFLLGAACGVGLLVMLGLWLWRRR